MWLLNNEASKFDKQHVCVCVYSALLEELQAGCVTHMRVYQ